MPALPPRNVFSRSSEQASWIARVGENLHQLLIPIHLRTSNSKGAPLHLVDVNHGHRGGRAQIYSMLTHAMAIAFLLYLAAGIKNETMRRPAVALQEGTILRYVPPRAAQLFGDPSLGRNGGSGDENSIPATRGNLAPRSSLQLLAPHLPQNEKPELPVPVTIFDANAPPFTNPVTHLGLPWMPSETESPGPGKNHGIGEGPGHGMGDEGWNE